VAAGLIVTSDLLFLLAVVLNTDFQTGTRQVVAVLARVRANWQPDIFPESKSVYAVAFGMPLNYLLEMCVQKWQTITVEVTGNDPELNH